MLKRTLSGLATLFILIMTPLMLHAADDMRVDFKEAQINMSTDTESSWNFLDVILYLRGEGLKNAKGYYDPVFTKIETDNASLLDKNTGEEAPGFRAINPIKSGNDGNRLWKRADKLPARTDKHLYVQGYVDVYMNTDKDNIIDIDNYLEHSGKPVQHPLLKKHNVELSFLTKDDMIEYKERQQAQKGLKDSLTDAFGELFKGMFGIGGEDLTFVIKDDNNAVLMVELLDKDGEAMERQSWSTSKDSKTGVIMYGVDYKKMLPHKGKVRISINDGDSLRRVPYKHKIDLP